MADIVCPVCGLLNPAGALTCFNCLSALGESIQPGEAPTKKGTGELEPILPEWLRTAREKSRQSTGSQIDEPEEKPQPIPDLLAGLEAQSTPDDDEEVPDWLARITGTAGTKKNEPEQGGARRVELGRSKAGNLEETQPARPVAKPSVPAPEEETPPWLKALAGADKDGEAGELEDWFKQAAVGAGEQAAHPLKTDERGGTRETTTPPAEEPSQKWPDRLQPKSPASDSPVVETDLIEWLNSLEPPDSGMSSELPDWLQHLDAPPPESFEPAERELPAGKESEDLERELPNWLKDIQPETEPAPALSEAELADWLKDLRDTSFHDDAQEGVFRPLESDQRAEAGAGVASVQAEEADLPGLLADMAEGTGPETPTMEAVSKAETAEPEALEAELPDWLKALEPVIEEPRPGSDDFSRLTGEEAALPGLPKIPSESVPAELISATLDVELPDWLDQLGKEQDTSSQADLPDWLTEGVAPEPGAEITSVDEQNAISGLETPEQLETLPEKEPSEEEGPVLEPEPLTEGEISSLFTGVPDWLEKPDASESVPGEAVTQSAPEEAETIAPADLPAWVQAMRPVEAALSSVLVDESEEEMMETSGPLAGLRGVLPSFAYPGPSSRPRSQAARLQPEEDQLGHAALLEQILQAETSPEPMAVPAALAPLRGLRLGIGLVLLMALLAAVLAGTTFIPLPSGRPVETLAAIEVVEAVPVNAAALIVFDYEPSLAGEMEAVAAPLLDHLIVLKAPRLTLLSTSPTGSALAERMMISLAARDYTNLGYLAGGLGGVRSFAQDPPMAMPLQADSTPWDAPVTQGIRHMADYAAIIVITDSADSGRTWIEQVSRLIGPDRFVVVASAQAGPMLQPYHQANQIRGLVTGLFDSAVLEQNNAGRPGLARRYWDAYNIGLILAVVLLAFGAAWNLLQGIRERAARQEAE